MGLLPEYGYTQVMDEVSVVHNADDFISRIVPVHSYTQVVITYDITVAFSGGSSPGLTFTLQADVSGDGEWVDVTTLQTTDNGYASAAPTDPTITTTGKTYRYYGSLVGVRIRAKVSVSGSPTGGTATINAVYLVAE